MPEAFQHLEVAEGVHALPEAIVAVNHELAIPGQVLQGLALQNAPIVDGEVVENLRLEDEEPPVDEALGGLGLLGEAANLFAFHEKLSESGGRMDAGDRGKASVRLVKFK